MGHITTLKTVINRYQIEQRLGVSLATIAEFCQQRQITELALFGSVLREDFHPESDIDFLINFSPEAKIGLEGVIF